MHARAAATAFILFSTIFAVAFIPLVYAADRQVRFNGGTATITSDGDTEHIVIRRGNGELSGESSCTSDSGHYDEIVAFFQGFQTKVVTGDKTGVADLMSFPLRLNRASPAKPKFIASRTAFLKHYDAAITPAIIASIRNAQPYEVFCRDEGAMFGFGIAWVHKDEKRRLGVFVVNQ